MHHPKCKKETRAQNFTPNEALPSSREFDLQVTSSLTSFYASRLPSSLGELQARRGPNSLLTWVVRRRPSRAVEEPRKGSQHSQRDQTIHFYIASAWDCGHIPVPGRRPASQAVGAHEVGWLVAPSNTKQLHYLRGVQNQVQVWCDWTWVGCSRWKGVERDPPRVYYQNHEEKWTRRHTDPSRRSGILFRPFDRPYGVLRRLIGVPTMRAVPTMRRMVMGSMGSMGPANGRRGTTRGGLGRMGKERSVPDGPPLTESGGSWGSGGVAPPEIPTDSAGGSGPP